ncbi:amino acid deaminase [Martelella alba]|uniref:Amino acid deaminase n=1 Tax=Martelella alba TaxID=2590451 RepID=A0A506U4A7_9HYPH|nr:alanine racemase [Martelella alba]TPW28288.1 amino acid deaminase [Martelella alba]
MTISYFRGIAAPVSARLDMIEAPGLRPQSGAIPLPVLALDEDVFEANCRAMFGYAEKAGVLLAPHAKTPMSPELAQRLIDQGAFSLSAANYQQAAVLAGHGVRRVLIANEIGGKASGQRFATLAREYPGTEFSFFVDSLSSLAAVAEIGKATGQRVEILIEVGTGRGGARDIATVRSIVTAALAEPAVRIVGVSTYEGAAAKATIAETSLSFHALFALTLEAFALIREALPDQPLYLSAGGSSYFDMVIDALKPAADRDGNTKILLRSGAIYFHDHGVYQRALSALDERGGFVRITGKTASESFAPALSIYAEVLSRPEPGLAICGMGMRDVSYDQDLPLPLSVWRDDVLLYTAPSAMRVAKLNDQHAFVTLHPHAELEVGDIVAFGISHPCTCLDRWRLIFGHRADGVLSSVYPTYFG